MPLGGGLLHLGCIHFFCWYRPLHSFNQELLEVVLCRVLDNGAGVDNGGNAIRAALRQPQSLHPPKGCEFWNVDNGRIERLDTKTIPILGQDFVGESHSGSFWGDMGCPTALYVDVCRTWLRGQRWADQWSTMRTHWRSDEWFTRRTHWFECECACEWPTHESKTRRRLHGHA